MLSRNSLRDQIALASNAARLRRPAFAVIDALQKQQVAAGEAILGAAVALIATCQSTGLNLQDVMTKASNMMADAEGPFTAHIQSVRDFAKNHFLNGGRPR